MVWKILIIILVLFAATGLLWVNNEPSVPVVKPTFQYNGVSLARIFSNDHSWISTLSAQRIRTVIATGDIIPARSVNFRVLQYKDFNWPYLNTYQLTKDADITFSNLEAPEIKNCPTTNEGMIFCGDYKNVEGLKFAGIDVVSLANNHAGNYGADGVKETMENLKTAGIDATGTIFSNLVFKNIRGMRFAFLGFNDVDLSQPGVSNVNEDNIKTEITEAHKQADIVVVTFHWGVEYAEQPDTRQKYLAHLAVDSEADLIIGNHPHWIQPVEIYKGKLIAYAHGNFVFDQMWSQKTREGVIGKYIFYDNKLVDVEYLPIQINDYGQPNPILGDAKKAVLENMRNASFKLQSLNGFPNHEDSSFARPR